MCAITDYKSWSLLKNMYNTVGDADLGMTGEGTGSMLCTKLEYRYLAGDLYRWPLRV